LWPGPERPRIRERFLIYISSLRLPEGHFLGLKLLVGGWYIGRETS
jgi:hypothetical protein